MTYDGASNRTAEPLSIKTYELSQSPLARLVLQAMELLETRFLYLENSTRQPFNYHDEGIASLESRVQVQPWRVVENRTLVACRKPCIGRIFNPPPGP